MKIQYNAAIHFVLSSLFFSACQTETDLSFSSYPENARLIRVLHYSSLKTQKDAHVEEYEYDGEGKLIKTSHDFYRDGERAGIAGYEEYEYDVQKRLAKIAFFDYNNINEGFTNQKNILFSYDNNGLKEKETIEHPKIGSTEEVIFHHDGRKKLILKQNINSSQLLDSYHLFKYNAQDQLTEESIHDINDRLMRKHIYHYENGNNTETRVYVGDTNELLRKITKTFDRNKNLILLQSEELAIYSSATSYIQKFEYE